MVVMNAPAKPRRLKQFVLKPTVFCYHRCPYCDLRQDYYREMVLDRKRALPLAIEPGSRRPNPGHMPLDLALRTIDEAAALGMEELQLSGGDPLLYPHLIEVIGAAKKHRGVFVLMNSVGTGVTAGKARQVIEAGLGAWNFSVDTLDPGRRSCSPTRRRCWPVSFPRRLPIPATRGASTGLIRRPSARRAGSRITTR